MDSDEDWLLGGHPASTLKRHAYYLERAAQAAENAASSFDADVRYQWEVIRKNWLILAEQMEGPLPD